MTDLTSAYNADSDENKLVLCDCNGTIFSPTHDQPLNEKLWKLLVSAKEAGYRVVFMSDDPVGNQKTLELVCQWRLKDPKFFGEVQSKSSLSGKKALVVFDDDHSSHKVQAAGLIDPKNAAVIHKVGFWLSSGLDEAQRHIEKPRMTPE